MKTLKVLSLLLSYPTGELQAAAEEIRGILQDEGVLRPDVCRRLCAFVDNLAAMDIYDAQERYGLLFDRTKSLSLHLFEHVHGESRDRGQAMVDLIRIYEEAGFSPTLTELPDFLPLFLEFAATRPAADAIGLISEPGHVLSALHERLLRRRAEYAVVFEALVELTGARLDAAQIAALNAEVDPEPDDLEALDAAWEEEEVTFGPGAAATCGKDQLSAKIRQARRPAPGLEPSPGHRPQTIVSTSSSARTSGASS